MSIFSILILTVYTIAAVALFIYGMNCYVMVMLYLKRTRKDTQKLRTFIDEAQPMFDSTESTPRVTTQIPLYNEANVAERVIRAVAAMDYPKGCHEVQVLDDSTDETCEIVDKVAADLRAEGKDVVVFRREIRQGYKAGALKEGMAVCKGEYVAIFDSDFVPPANYLKQLVPVLHEDNKLGFVQARWGHLNAGHSLLTKAQSIGIDGHFIIEQSARAFNKLFLNFNGTAGIWRKEAIEDAGNWQSDTLTEDMDLSYRCQLAGWKATYVPDVVVPAELPQTYTAFKSQQFRWAKGSIQTAIKLLPQVWGSKEKSFFAKVQSIFHLTHYSIHPFMALMSLMSLPVLYLLDVAVPTAVAAMVFAGIGVAMVGPSLMYFTSQSANKRPLWEKLLYLPALMCVGVGIAVSNTRAVLEAVLGVQSGFIRTPKDGAKTVKSYTVKKNWIPWIELALGSYCLFSLSQYVYLGKAGAGPFLLIYSIGFLTVGYHSLREHYRTA